MTETATRCAECGELQFECPSGMTCPNGHGGAPGVAKAEPPPEPFRGLARLICRGGIAGLVIPLRGAGRPLEGVYEIREVLGELMLRRMGDSAMENPQRDALQLNGLFNERGTAGLTKEEWRQVVQQREQTDG